MTGQRPAPRSGPQQGRRFPQHDPMEDPTRREGLDPGAFIGRKPERQAQTIPGGVSRKDERISAVASQPGDTPSTPGDANTPEGHREGGDATSSTLREAGQNR